MTRILVVDDMAVFREPIAASLRARGYQTDCAGNGNEALDQLKRARPDLILLDVAMPGMNGLDFLAVIRRDKVFAKCPVILLTAVAERDHVLKARDLGVRDYLLKSHFSLSELERRIQQCLANAASGLTPADGLNGANGATGAPGAAGAASPNGAAGNPAAATNTNTNTNTNAYANASGDAASGATAPGGAPAVAPSPGVPASSASLNPAAADAPPAPPAQTVKDLRPIITRSDMDALLRDCGEIKGLSSTITEVQKLSRSPNSTAEQIARTIKRDQAIALKILKLANSSAYARGEPADSVEKAVVRIGTDAIGQAVLNLGVVEEFGDSGDEDILEPRLFWEHAIATGLIAAAITRQTEIMPPDSAFTLGLLHDVGRMVYLDLLGDKYRQTMQTARQIGAPLERVETRMLLVNHADAMDRILRAWQFPADLIDPIVLHHHEPDEIRKYAPKRYEQVLTLVLANRLAHALMLGSSGNEVVHPTAALCEDLGINGETMQAIQNTIPDQTDEVKFAMLASGGVGVWPRRLEWWRQQLESEIRPVCLCANPDFDGFRIFFDRLVGEESSAGAGEPNLAVVHMTNVRERSPLTAALRDAEKNAGDGPLPAIILSPQGHLELEAEAMADRPLQKLATPATMRNMIDAARALVPPT